MALVPIQVQPGIVKNNSDYTAGKTANGRYVDGDKVRFQSGFPEKLGGWLKIASGMLGVPRAVKAWRDYLGNPQAAIGTSSHLYAFDGSALTDITPWRTLLTGTLTNAISTSSGSQSVSVNDNTQFLVAGDWVYLSADSAVGGLTLNGWYSVLSATAISYTITSPIAATSSGGTGGGAISYGYPRKRLSSPFQTFSGSASVTVTDALHGAATGDYVIFTGASEVGGLTISGEYQLTVVDGNSYTITASGNASSNAIGGGNPTITYDVTIIQPSGSGSPNTYGSGNYGVGLYGASSVGGAAVFGGWTMAPYGNLMTAAPLGGEIYIYDSQTGGRAYPLLNAPTTELGHFITPERFVVALGTNGNLLTIAWADQNDFTVWTSTSTNTANSGRTIQGGGFFVGGIGVRDGVSLLFTNKTVIAKTYTGDNFIYSTPQISDNSGLISPFAVGVLGGVAYWMSDSEFWLWNGVVTPIPSSDIRDWVFGSLTSGYAWKSFATVQRQHKEVWFFYCANGSTEINAYVIYHTDAQCWSPGNMVRTAATDADLFLYPLATDSSGNLYYHEYGWDADGAAMDATITLSPQDISNGDRNMDMFGFIPDFTYLTGNVSLTINTRYYPQDTNAVDGPYTITDSDTTPRLDLRSDGKMIGYKLESNVVGGKFRVGVMRADVHAAGARR